MPSSINYRIIDMVDLNFLLKHWDEELEISKNNIIEKWGNKVVNNKILCLHGGGDSDVDLENQLGMQKLINSLQNYEFEFIDSPRTPLGYTKIWWDDPPGGKGEPTNDRNWANTSIKFITNYIINNGPFYGLLGYSQGSAMVIVYGAYSNYKFDCLLMFNGYLPTTHHGLIDTIDEKKPFQTPALNYIAKNDTGFYSYGEDINNDYFSNLKLITNRSVYAGHFLPTEDDNIEIVTNFVNTLEINS